MLSAELIFFALAAVVVITALGMVLSRNSVYSALFLVLNFVIVGLLYVVMGAPFIAMAQVTVYAGAIMVLFLFVIMLLGAERLRETEALPYHRTIAIILGGLFIVTATVAVVLQAGPLVPLPEPPAGFASPTDVGLALYQKYTLPFEITSVILLAAMVGAIILTRQGRTRRELMAGKKDD